jgi:paraquat-inducible protein B
VEPHEYDEILRHLVRIATHPDTINEDQRVFNRQRIEINQDIKTTLAHVEITQARVETTLAGIETLLARMIRHEDNGRDA